MCGDETRRVNAVMFGHREPSFAEAIMAEAPRVRKQFVAMLVRFLPRGVRRRLVAKVWN